MNSIQRIEKLQEQMICRKLDSGLDVFYVPKPGFAEQFAVLTARYGSIDHHFARGDTGEDIRVPDGIAHFLEHTVFEKESGNISDRFSDLGAYHNAYTSFIATAYLFSCASNFDEHLRTLMDLAFQPYFSADSVEKEKGIIEQEINMYDDMPQWKVYFNLLQALYHHHPVRINIAGDIASVRSITPDILHTCHDVFYHPGNMALFVAGNVDLDAMVRQVESYLDASGYQARPAPVRLIPHEPASVKESRVELQAAVPRPLVYMGFKEGHPATAPMDLLHRDLANEILLDLLVGRGSALFNRLYEAGVITGSLDTEYTNYDHFGFTLLGTETDHPDRLVDEVCKEVELMRKSGFDAQSFVDVRRKIVGNYIQSFDSLDRLVNASIGSYHRGYTYLDYDAALRNVTMDAVWAHLQSHWQPDAFSVSVVRP